MENDIDMNNHVCVSTDVQNTSDMDIIPDDIHEKNKEIFFEETKEGNDIESSEKNEHVRVRTIIEDGEGIVTQKSSDVILGNLHLYFYMVNCVYIYVHMYICVYEIIRIHLLFLILSAYILFHMNK